MRFRPIYVAGTEKHGATERLFHGTSVVPRSRPKTLTDRAVSKGWLIHGRQGAINFQFCEGDVFVCLFTCFPSEQPPLSRLDWVLSLCDAIDSDGGSGGFGLGVYTTGPVLPRAGRGWRWGRGEEKRGEAPGSSGPAGKGCRAIPTRRAA